MKNLAQALDIEHAGFLRGVPKMARGAYRIKLDPLTDAEKRGLIAMIQVGKPLPENYCFLYIGSTSVISKEFNADLLAEAVLTRCKWGHDDYSLKVENIPPALAKVGQQEFAL